MRPITNYQLPMTILMAFALAACTPQIRSSHVWLTSEAGDKCAEKEAVVFHKGAVDGAISVDLDDRRQ